MDLTTYHTLRYNAPTMSSLDRLIRLVERTGDRLIVHDSMNGRDIVLLDIDSYERLLGHHEETELIDGLPEDLSKEEEPSWQHTRDILKERYGDGTSFVEEMWNASNPKEDQGVLLDARTEREEAGEKPVPKEEMDDPVFYEEPLQ